MNRKVLVLLFALPGSETSLAILPFGEPCLIVLINESKTSSNYLTGHLFCLTHLVVHRVGLAKDYELLPSSEEAWIYIAMMRIG